MIAAEAKILITGAGGMVGKALAARLRDHKNLLTPTHAELDLEDRKQTLDYFAKQLPDYVFHLAAKVGGIAYNIKEPVNFLEANARMGLNVLEACHHAQVKKTLVLGSSCMYPRECAQPMREASLMTGSLEPTNEGYALAKLLTLKLSLAYHAQYGLKMVNPLASNIYGPGDHFDLERSHVLSALVKRFSDAKRDGAPSVKLWGTGKAKREFVHVQDVADGMLFMMEKVESAEPMNLGPGTDLSIRELAELISTKVGFTGALEWDDSKPDGMPRKCMDVSKLKALGFRTKISLASGIDGVLEEYRKSL